MRAVGQVRRVVAILGVLLVAGSSESRAEAPHHPVNFSFFHPLSLSNDPTASTNFRLNLLYGRVVAIRGFDLSGVVARVHGDMRGVQLTGAVSVTGGEVRGLAVSGGFGYVAGDGRGLQASGLISYAHGAWRGLQYASLFNYAEQEIVGAQVSTVYNLANADVRYVQFASIVNAISGSLRGIQASGGINYVQEQVTGIQAGLFDYARQFHGAQVGLLNWADTAHGAQIGLVNIAKENGDFALGLVNVAKNGGADWVTFASSYAAINTGIRTSLRGFYSMLTLGSVDLVAEREDTAFLTWNYGYAFGIARRWQLDTDLGFVHVVPGSGDDPAENDRLHFALQARALGELHVGDRTSIFGGAGVSTVFSEYSSDATTEVEPLVVVGISMY